MSLLRVLTPSESRASISGGSWLSVLSAKMACSMSIAATSPGPTNARRWSVACKGYPGPRRTAQPPGRVCSESSAARPKLRSRTPASATPTLPLRRSTIPCAAGESAESMSSTQHCQQRSVLCSGPCAPSRPPWCSPTTGTCRPRRGPAWSSRSWSVAASWAGSRRCAGLLLPLTLQGKDWARKPIDRRPADQPAKPCVAARAAAARSVRQSWAWRRGSRARHALDQPGPWPQLWGRQFQLSWEVLYMLVQPGWGHLSASSSEHHCCRQHGWLFQLKFKALRRSAMPWSSSWATSVSRRSCRRACMTRRPSCRAASRTTRSRSRCAPGGRVLSSQPLAASLSE